MDAMKLTKAQAWPVVGRVFSEYRGRKFAIKFVDRITFSNTNWGGGTKNEYAAVKSNGARVFLDAPAPWENPVEGATLEMPPDVLIVMRSWFCGREMGCTIFAHPVHIPKWLTEGGLR